MNTRLILLIFSLSIIQLKDYVYAQTNSQLGGLPSINLNTKLRKGWSLNAKIESRQLFQREILNGNIEFSSKYILTDISLLTAKKVGLNSRIAGGYLIRIEEGGLTHRFIQQYIIVQKMSGFRLAHRFLSDQTYSEDESPEFRLRYRITSEIPLNGESVDQGEFYLKINNEYINSFQASEYDLEIRLVPLIGYEINDNLKMETGLDYRVRSFLNNITRHKYWMSLNFFIDM